MKSEETTAKPLVVSILSLSLLTVMAGAAVAPALGVIQEYFADSSPVLVQMIISIPAIFIVITNSIFPRLCKRFGAKALTMIGLLLYTVGGCIAGSIQPDRSGADHESFCRDRRWHHHAFIHRAFVFLFST